MGFIKVRDAKGREADITQDEIARYRSIGFTPVSGQSFSDETKAAKEPEPVSSTDQRLDSLIDEIRGLRADFAKQSDPEPKDGETVELRGVVDPGKVQIMPATTTEPKPDPKSPTKPEPKR